MSNPSTGRRNTAFASQTNPHWFDPQALRPVVELNDLLLQALIADAASPRSMRRLSLSNHVGDLFAEFPAEARTRIAECPFALVDAGFDDADRWVRVKNGTYVDAGKSRPPLPSAYGQRLAQMMLILAWSLARSNRDAAHVVLGMSQRCAAVVGDIGLSVLPSIAEQHAQLIRPRWEDRPDIWRQLLQLAFHGVERNQPPLSVRAMEYFLTDLRRQEPLSGQNRRKGG